MTNAKDIDLHPLLVELMRRGFLADCTDLAGLSERLAAGPVRAYIGFDPTADSLHVGSLMPLFAARLLQRHGHIPVLLVGGATGMIGDPSGRAAERSMLDDDELDRNRRALQAQILSLVSPADGEVVVVDNRDWIGPMSAIELLRDVGRHFPVNSMLAKDSVRLRRESESGLTFTEFAYQVLQAFDFWWLRTNMDVEVQMGGSDQWGNITAGTDFMRRKDGSTGFGLVWPLLTKADGGKFGKSADGNVWLDSRRTRPFDFWQFWFNVDDADVETMLLRFAAVPVDAIADLMTEHRRNPGARLAQRALADDVTAWVHGARVAGEVADAAAILFGDKQAPPAALAIVERHVGAVHLDLDEAMRMSVLELSVRAGLCASQSEARRLIAAGGLRLDGATVVEDRDLALGDVADGWMLLRRGRRNAALVCVGGER